MLSRWNEPSKFTRAMTLLFAMANVGSLLATLPLAAANEWVGWRTTFVVLGIATGLIGVIFAMLVRDYPEGAARPAQPLTLAAAIGGMREVFRTPGLLHVMPMIGIGYSSIVTIVGLWGGPYLHDVYGLDGAHHDEIALPGIGAVTELSGRADQHDVWFTFSSPLSPATVYRFDLPSRTRLAFEPPHPPLDTSAFETRALFATSKDGTRVPFFLTCRKDIRLDGRNPTMLYGYGGFSISVLPFYRSDVPAWLELGGVFVSVNMRGGAEYGEAWHKGGSLEKKQNVFDDFIAAAEWLVANKYTNPSKLAAQGGSNGGLLVGAVINQRPDLFRVAIPQVGVMDMLRFHKFTIGWNWIADYGSSDNPEEFKALRAYSPLHNIKAGVKYPATLVTTADRKSTRLNSSHVSESRMPSSA